MDNTKIAENLNEIADLLDIKGEKPFRIRAYRKAAEILQILENNLAEFYKKEKKLPKIKGIGESIGGKIEELIKTGKIKYLKELQHYHHEVLQAYQVFVQND